MDNEERAETGTDDSTETTRDVGELFNQYLSLIDEVSELTRLDYNQVWKMNIGEFFTYVNFSRWKSKRKADAIARWKNENKY